MHTLRGRLVIVLLFLFVAAGTGVARANPITFTGYFNDPGNSALVGWDLGAALFGDDWDIANNVAMYDLVVPIAGDVRFRSLGFAAGGADPYFTLFDGVGTGAAFLDSNYAQAFSTGGDFDITRSMLAGTYTFALGVFPNMSSAENYGSGTLGDGFTFGSPMYLGSSYYALEVTTPEPPPVPEPSSMLLLASGLAGCSALRRRLRKSRVG